MQAKLIIDNLVKLRAEYLISRGEKLNIKSAVNPNLEEWFTNDPTEQIVRLEAAISNQKQKLSSIEDKTNSERSNLLENLIDVAKEDKLGENDEHDSELLLPLGTNSIIVDNEQHTMSMLVFYLQLDNTSLEKSCLLEVEMEKDLISSVV